MIGLLFRLELVLSAPPIADTVKARWARKRSQLDSRSGASTGHVSRRDAISSQDHAGAV